MAKTKVCGQRAYQMIEGEESWSVCNLPADHADYQEAFDVDGNHIAWVRGPQHQDHNFELEEGGESSS